MSSMCRYLRTVGGVCRAKPLIAMVCQAVSETRQLRVVTSLTNHKKIPSPGLMRYRVVAEMHGILQCALSRFFDITSVAARHLYCGGL
jgi:hypothetical protein